MTGLNLDGVGFTLDELDIDDELPALPLDRPRHRGGSWWATSDGEAHHLDLPDFETGADRARYMINQMGRAALAMIPGSTPHDAIFPLDGVLVSLKELLAIMDARELATLLGGGFDVE